MGLSALNIVPKSGPSILTSGGIILVLAHEQAIGVLCIILGFALSVYWGQMMRHRK